MGVLSGAVTIKLSLVRGVARKASTQQRVSGVASEVCASNSPIKSIGIRSSFESVMKRVNHRAYQRGLLETFIHLIC